MFHYDWHGPSRIEEGHSGCFSHLLPLSVSRRRVMWNEKSRVSFGSEAHDLRQYREQCCRVSRGDFGFTNQIRGERATNRQNLPILASWRQCEVSGAGTE